MLIAKELLVFWGAARSPRLAAGIQRKVLVALSLFFLHRRQPHDLGRPLLRHLTRALEEGALLDLHDGRAQSREDPGSGEKLAALARLHLDGELSIDRQPADLNVRVHVGGIPEDELRPGPDFPFEPAVDPEGLLEGQIALEVAASIEEAVQGRAVASRLHSRPPFFPARRSKRPMSSSSNETAISSRPPRRRRTIRTRVARRRESFSSASRVNGSRRCSRRTFAPPESAAIRLSVCRTDRARRTISSESVSWSPGEARASSARACPADRVPSRTFSRTEAGNFSSRRELATVARSLPTRRAMSSCVR